MDRSQLADFIELLEQGEHGLTIEEWVSVLRLYSRVYRSRGLASPVQFVHRNHVLSIYAARREKRFDLFHPSDLFLF